MTNQEKSTERLQGELKVIKAITIILGVVLSLLLATCIYGIVGQDGNRIYTTLIVVPFALMPILFLNMINMNKIKKELKSRT